MNAQANSQETEKLFAECAGCHAFHQLVRFVGEKSPAGYVYLQPSHTCVDGFMADGPAEGAR